MRSLLIGLCFLGTACCLAGDNALTITIAEPRDGGEVAWKAVVRGSISNGEAEVWVMVHPVETDQCWPNPSRTEPDGKWQTVVQCGRSKKLDSGQHFEIMAIANPTDREALRVAFSKGQPVKCWPRGETQSKSIVVVRK